LNAQVRSGRTLGPSPLTPGGCRIRFPRATVHHTFVPGGAHTLAEAGIPFASDLPLEARIALLVALAEESPLDTLETILQ